MHSSRLVNRNIVAERGRTSMRLEPELWDALAGIAERKGCGLHELVRSIENGGGGGGRTSQVRVFIVQELGNGTATASKA